MTLRSAIVAGICVAIWATSGSLPALAADLTVAVPDSRVGAVVNAAIVQAFAKASGLSVAVATTDGTLTAAREAHADAMLTGTAALADGCKDGTFVKLDWKALGGRDRFLPSAASDCGEGAALHSLVLAWNRDKFPAAPSWSEFWDVAKVPGKRGLRHGARSNLEIALLADGVAPADVYTTLRTDAGVERAFRKLDQLKPYLVWWKQDADAAHMLASGDVLMTSAPAAEIIAAERSAAPTQHLDFAIQWDANLTSIESWAILANPAGTNAPGAIAAGRLLAFAADPKQQRALPQLSGIGGADVTANDGLPPDQLSQSPSAPANLAKALIVDDQFWRDNGSKLDKLYEAWLAK